MYPLEKTHYAVREFVTWQKENLGQTIFGEDGLYAMARRGGVRGIIRVGGKKVMFTRELLEQLLAGDLDTSQLLRTAK
jgi:hypothetical protein